MKRCRKAHLANCQTPATTTVFVSLPVLKFSGFASPGSPSVLTSLADDGNVSQTAFTLPGPMFYAVPKSQFSRLGATLLEDLPPGDDLTVHLAKNGVPIPGASVTFTGPLTAPVTLYSSFPVVSFDGTTETLDVLVDSTNLTVPTLVSAVVSS